MILALKIAVGAVLVYAIVLAGAYYLQRTLMYFPARERIAPAAAGLAGVEERVIETPDGAHVIAWYGKARPGRPTLLYFHGNGGALATRAERIGKYLARGYGVLMMTYRGYGGSTGRPSERANVADAKLAYDTLTGLGVDPSEIVVYGESIGSGVAVQVAAEKPVAGVILDAPYTSVLELAAAAYPLLPVRTFLTDRYETMRYIGRVAAPLLVVHGEADNVIPVAMGRAVHAAATGPKEIVTFPRAGHSDHHLYGSYEAIFDWLERLEAARARSVAPRAANEIGR
ncbi:MAG: alpha/beta fold hydrolase [Pseudomonadota bacterium]